jgi:hypothetical protein
MNTSASGLTSQGLRPIVKIDAEAIVAAINKGVSGASVVVCPGNPGGASGNVYLTLADALAALAAFDGPRQVQFDDRYVSPIVVPVNPLGGPYQTDDIEWVGNFDFVSSANVQVHWADGAEISHLSTISYGMDWHSASTTVPVYTVKDVESCTIIEYGAALISDPGATQPFMRAPVGLTHQVVIVMDTGATLGATGQPALDIGAGTNVLLVLMTFATLPSSVITGAGTAVVALDAGSVQSNTTLPITQPGVGTLLVVDFTSAPFVRLADYTNPANWAGAPPVTTQDAIERMAALLKTLNGGVPIP